MKKIVPSLVAAATVVASVPAFAQDKGNAQSPVQAPPGATVTTPTAAPPTQTQMQTDSQGQTGGQTPTQGKKPCPPKSPTATTTVTAGEFPEEGAATPVPSAAVPPPAESITVNQSVRPNKPLLYSGAILFLGAYVPTVAITAANINNPIADKSNYIPVVGPWLHIADANGAPAGNTVLITASGIVQGLGVGLMALGLVIPQKVPATTITAGNGNVKVDIAPTTYGKSGAGVGAHGTF